MCEKVCPIKNKSKFEKYEQKAYLFQNKVEKAREDSTSGGFYTAIGKYVIEKKGIVFGAIFDDNFKVKHWNTDNVDELSKFRKSKYVQSNPENTFEEAKLFLEQGKLVCYSGTPCQIEGLKRFLSKNYENLITIDIMCHSVPSPLVFEKYKQYILKKMNANKILDINFRDKSNYGYKYSMMTINTDNGKYSQGIDTDPYLRAFFGDYSVRPSCYDCKFKTQQRVSDITIWDCFNVGNIDKNFNDDKGTTRILVHSKKGEEIINNLKNNKIKEIPVNLAINGVREMTNSVQNNSKRDEFFEKINKDVSFDILFPENFKTKLNSFIRKFLCITGIYDNVKFIAKKILNK